MKKFILLIVFFVFAFAISVSATQKLSPAIDVLANEYSMVKASTLTNGELFFDVNDFDDGLGTNVKSITISALPDETVGRLMLDNLYIIENQVIYREDFSMLKFVYSSDKEEAVFKFMPNGHSYEIECSLRALESVNLSPVASNGSILSSWTNSEITCFGVLEGFDPDGDELKFEVVSYPQKGLLEITNSKTGDYKYTPYEKASGTDGFTYRVRDSYGNYSELCTVKMSIKKLRTSLVFSDIEEERYLNVAIVSHNKGLIKSVENDDGTISFKPNEEITTEEFIVLVMNVMGAKNVPVLEKTRFADDTDISPEYKGYLEVAFSLGIISGVNEADGVHIYPKKSITTAEASVILNNIIGAKAQASMTVFLDYDDIPSWAKDSIISLTELGILKKTDGKIAPNSPLTRAQTAQILVSLLEQSGRLK